MKNWFSVEQIDKSTYCFSEYRHWEETHCYLLVGLKRCLLIDTGLGVGDLYKQVRKVTGKPVVAVATHVHWDHIGGHKEFPEFYVHKDELSWIKDKFPLPIEAVRKMVVDRCDLPDDYDVDEYKIVHGTPTRVLSDGDSIDLGDRVLKVLHTPGHSPGHMCFWEEDRGYLFTGDLAYKGELFANYPSTDPNAYLESIKKVTVLPVKRLFPGHHSLEISPEILIRMQEELLRLKDKGKLCHGAGVFKYEDWSISL